MKSNKHNRLGILAKSLYAICILLGNAAAHASSDSICSTASLVNPTAINGGMGGTGILENGGMGGTGIIDEHNGFGGTGSPVAQKGMGGTGISVAENSLLPEDKDGGIAIVGVITGFASICVDGVEVQYTPNTPVFENGKATKLGHLAAGKMVMLKAERVGDQLQARSIGMFDTVAGPIGRVDAVRQQMQVMGQNVRVTQNMIQQMQNVTTGTNVRVSGHRLENGEIVATRVDVTNNATFANTIGLVTSVSNNSFVLDGTRVNVNDTKSLSNIYVGNEVRVTGVWDGKAIKTDHLEVQPIKNIIIRADSAILEGYLGPNSVGKFSLYGTELEFSKSKNGDSNFSESKLVKIEMRRDKNGEWVADKVETRKDKFFDRGIQLNDEHDSKDGNTSGGGSSLKSGEIKSDSSGSNSGSGSSSGSGHGSSSSGSVSRTSGGSSSSGRSSGGGSSSSSGSSSRGGSGKYK